MHALEFSVFTPMESAWIILGAALVALVAWWRRRNPR